MTCILPVRNDRLMSIVDLVAQQEFLRGFLAILAIEHRGLDIYVCIVDNKLRDFQMKGKLSTYPSNRHNFHLS